MSTKEGPQTFQCQNGIIPGSNGFACGQNHVHATPFQCQNGIIPGSNPSDQILISFALTSRPSETKRRKTRVFAIIKPFLNSTPLR